MSQAAPTILQQIVFGREPNIWLVAAYSLALVVVFTGIVSAVAMFCIWWERKVAGHIQCRIGPNRVGPIGLLQSIADGVKLLLKEDLAPAEADGFLFRLAPYLAFAPAFAAFLALPFGPDFTFEPRLSVGVFWILAILSVEVMGVILAGWGSNNKWSVFGAMREACQMVSYEIPLGMSIIVGIMTAGTLNLVSLSEMQGGGIHTWLIFRSPLSMGAFLCYFIASLASNKRAPFDLPESESELVAGYHTEYSGLRFSFFFFAEYAAMFVVGGIQTALFLGGWHDPFGIVGFFYAKFKPLYLANPSIATAVPVLIVNLIASGIFASKCLFIIFVQMWLRWTLPRPRIDQVLYACVKVLLPMSCALLALAAVWQLFMPALPGVPWVDYQPFNVMSWTSQRATPALVTQIILASIGISLMTMLAGWIGWAFITGRGLKKRLTDPAPIEHPKVALA